MTTPSLSNNLYVLNCIFGILTRNKNINNISNIYTSDIFLIPPAGNLSIFLTEHNYPSIIIPDSCYTENDSSRSIHNNLFKDNFAIHKFEFEFIYSLTCCYIDSSISWDTNIFDYCISL